MNKYLIYGLDRLCCSLKLDKSFFPYQVSVFVNSVCNSKCITCDIGQKNKKSHFYNLYNKKTDLDIKILKKLVNEVKNYNTGISFMGTEPLLYPKIIEAIRIVKNTGLDCSLTTNGILLPKLAEELVGSGIDGINVSVDGTENIHDKIRGVKSFDKIVKGLEIINKRINISIWTTISHYNQHNLYETYKYFKNLVDNHLFMHLSFVDSKMLKKQPINIPATELHIKSNPKSVDLNILEKQIDLIGRKSFVPDIYGKDLEKYYKASDFVNGFDECKALWFSCLMASDGKIYPATRCYNIEMGDLKNDSLKNIFNSNKFKHFRSILKGKALPACARCCAVWTGSHNKKILDWLLNKVYT